jgi:hypothetical protein
MYILNEFTPEKSNTRKKQFGEKKSISSETNQKQK